MTYKVISRAGRRFVFALLCLLALVLPQAALATITAVTLANGYDGTAGWDPNSTTPGFDSANNNLRVRTNDSYGYNVTLSTTGAADTNVTFVLDLATAPATWKAVPGFCSGTGSGIDAAGKVMTCNVGTINGTQTFPIGNAFVLGTTPNGATIPVVALSVRSDQSPTPPATLVTAQPLTVTAFPYYDVVIQMSYNGNPRAYGFTPGNGPAGQDGFYIRPMVGLVGKNPNGNGAKGVEMLQGPIGLTVDTSGMGNGTGAVLDNYHTGTAPNGTPAASADFQDGCGSPSAAGATASAEMGGAINMYDRMGDNGVAASAANTVPNGGVCSVTSSSGTSVDISLVGTDTSLARRPSIYSGTSGLVPFTDFWVANKAMVFWTPVTAYPTGTVVTDTFKLGALDARSVSGQVATDVNPANNSTTYDIYNSGAGTVGKMFQPVSTGGIVAPYNTQCDPAVTSDCSVNYMTPGQYARVRLVYQNTGTTTHNNVEFCEFIDRTAFDIDLTTFPATVGVNGSATTTSTPVIEYASRAGGPYFTSTDSATDPYSWSSAGTSAYNSAKCSDPDLTWTSTPAQAEAAGGLVAIRIRMATVPASSNFAAYITGLRLRSTYANSISVLSPVSGTRSAGEVIANGTILRNQAHVLSSFSGLNDVHAADHLQVVTMRTTSRVDKTLIYTGGGGNVEPGKSVDFTLQTRYSTSFTPQRRDFTLVDILPPGLKYRANSTTIDGAANTPAFEPTIQANVPQAGYTTLTWTFPQVLPFLGPDTAAANLKLVRFTADVGLSVPSGSTLRNNAAVSGGPDDYEADCVYVVANQNYGNCQKADGFAALVQSTSGFRVGKTAIVQQIQPGENFGYELDFVSFGQAVVGVNVPDLIDVLPYVGDGVGNPANNFTGRGPVSKFTAGAAKLTSVVVPSNDPGMIVYYTNRAPAQINNDPHDASNNLVGGATVWCTAAQLGTAGCPATIGDSTAVRLQPGVTTLPADEVFKVRLGFSSALGKTRNGDFFANSVGARPPSPASTLLYVEAQALPGVSVTAGGLSGRVFLDVNQNRVVNPPQDKGLASQCVVLTGTTSTTPAANVAFSMLTDADGVFQFVPGAANSVHASVDCTGAAIADFGGIPAGTYSLAQLAQPTGYRDGADYAGDRGGTVGNDKVEGIVLTFGQSGANYHFTEQLQEGTLSGRIYYDANRNSAFDTAAGDALLSSVRLTLSGTVNGVPTTYYTCTGSDGSYGFDTAHAVYATDPGPACASPGTALANFTGVPPGNYTLISTTPPTYSDGIAIVGTQGGTAASPTQLTGVGILTGVASTGYDFTSYRSPPVAADDSKSNPNPGTATSLNAVTNDSDPDGNMDTKTLSFDPASVPAGSGTDTDGNGTIDKVVVPGQGTWTVDANGDATFTPVTGFYGDPTPIKYTIKDTTNLTSNVATITITYARAPAYNMAKTAGVAKVSTPGVITYTFTFTNNGNVPLKSLTVADANIDGGSLQGCPIANLDVGASASCTAKRTVTQVMLDAGVDIVNTATPSATDAQGNPVAEDNDGNPATPNDPADNTATVKVDRHASYNMVKTADMAKMSAPGVITYTFSFTNSGNVVLKGLTVADANIDTGSLLGCPITSLDVGAKATCTAKRTVTAAQLAAAATLTNTATPSATDSQGNVVAEDNDGDPGTPNDPADNTAAVQVVKNPPVAQDDSGKANNLDQPVTLPATANDTDPDGNLDASSVSFDPKSVPGGIGTDTDGNGTIDKVVVPGQGTWTVDKAGNVTFTPVGGFYGNPTPIQYTVKDSTNLVSNPATITITYPLAIAQLLVEKRGSVNMAEVGDTVIYTVNVRNIGATTVTSPVLMDHLPAGFSLVANTVQVSGATLVKLEGAPGPVLSLTLNQLAPNTVATVVYRLRIGVGAAEGDGINRASVNCPISAKPGACSNEARWKVQVTRGVFAQEACVAGKVFVDCNRNSVQDPEEIGIPGVRMYFENGTYLISDSEGKYSYCGLTPQTHVLKLDARTLPKDAILTTTSSRNAGDANSIFVDAKRGELVRADFIEGSCSNPVLEQVKARRTRGEIRTVDTEPGQPALKFESKPSPQGDPLQQGTDSANQPLPAPRGKP